MGEWGVGWSQRQRFAPSQQTFQRSCLGRPAGQRRAQSFSPSARIPRLALAVHWPSGMLELDSSAARAALLPGGAELFVVLFWRSGDATSVAWRRHCERVAWPRELCAVAVDLEAAPEIAAWFEPRIVPMLAVVTDGALLAVEYECTTEACHQLANRGYWQYSLMKTMYA